MNTVHVTWVYNIIQKIITKKTQAFILDHLCTNKTTASCTQDLGHNYVIYNMDSLRKQLAYLRGSIERVGVENRLYHHQRLSDILTIEFVTIVGTLVRAVVEHLEELGPSQVEHKLCVCVCVCVCVWGGGGWGKVN